MCAVGSAPLERFLFLGQKANLQRLDDRLRNLVLDRENILEVAVVAVRPDVFAARSVDAARDIDAWGDLPPAVDAVDWEW